MMMSRNCKYCSYSYAWRFFYVSFFLVTLQMVDMDSRHQSVEFVKD